MILHPGILALFLTSALVLAALLPAGWYACKILLWWNPDRHTEQQLALERQSWLISTVLNYALVAQILSLLLFVFIAEDIHRLFVGAMCATGSLNANLVGWLVLLVKGGLVFAASFWVIFNRLDQRTEDNPLMRRKYLLLLLLIPAVAADFYLQWRYFSGLNPEVITSCCGSLFSSAGEGVAAELSALPVGRSMMLFFTTVAAYLVALACTFYTRFRFCPYALFVFSLLLFFTALGAIISFISLYIYQLPSHHCPFDMLQAGYGYIGYPLYAGLYCASLFGMLPGLARPLKKYAGLAREIERVEKRWLLIAGGGVLLFLVCGCRQMLFGELSLLGY